MKVDVLAFGGGFASVSLLFHELVEARGWIGARTFMDGIALGQVTPGPIVVTATFVGYSFAGLAGAFVATLGVFAPSFVLVVALAPWVARIRSRPWFGHLVQGALLSFVGLLASVTVQFATAERWKVETIALAGCVFVAQRARVDVVWVALASGIAAALLL